jgi:glycosyltransferase involved in cell wall biosynthesis
LPHERWIKDSEEYANTHADGIICLGNQHTKETYAKFRNVITINNAVFPDNYQRCNINGARNNWLFFNGGGNVHKGLDLLLEAFAGLQDQHLYVRQNIQPEFEIAYRKELYGTPNIRVLSYVQRPDKDFYDLMNKCQFVITVSCAEGQPGSVLECMAHGLIPVLSKECNIDTEYLGETIGENTVSEIQSIVRKMSGLPDEKLHQLSRRNRIEIQAKYSPENFLENFKGAVLDLKSTAH